MNKRDHEDWLAAARKGLHERAKSLTDRQAADLGNENGAAVAEKYGIEITEAEPAPPEGPSAI